MDAENIKKTFQGWVRDLGEVIISLLIIIIVSRLIFGAQMLVPLVAVTSQSMLHHSGQDSWRTWLMNEGIPSEKIETFPLKSGFDRGDMILVKTPDGKGEILGVEFPTLFSTTKLGDVVIYNRDKEHGRGEPIIHRVVGIVRVKNFTVTGTEGTLECLTEEDFEKKYIPWVVNCLNGKKCPYWQFPQEGDLNFYLTKGDNNPQVDQCGSGAIAYPVNEEQLSARGWIRIPYVGWLKLILNEVLKLFLR